ncbi:MAG: hypothetical protein ACRDWA_09700 [Acidimicrobiia bacterium]
MGEIQGEREPVGRVTIAGRKGKLEGLELTDQLRLPGMEAIDFGLAGHELGLPPVDLIVTYLFEHLFSMKEGCDKIALHGKKSRKKPEEKLKTVPQQPSAFRKSATA